MRIIDGLNYREWQKRNTQLFSRFSVEQKKDLRSKGYKNAGWLYVQRTWQLIRKLVEQPDFFQQRLDNSDLLGAIRHSILEADQAKKFAQKSLEKIEANYQEVHNIARKTLSKYQLL